MPTIEEIGRRFKKRYAGSFDHVSDAEVGRRLKARYPDALSDVQGDDAPSRALLGESLSPTDPRFKGKTGPEAPKATLYKPPPTPDEIERAVDAEASGFIEGVKLAAAPFSRSGLPGAQLSTGVDDAGEPIATPNRMQLGGQPERFGRKPAGNALGVNKAKLQMMAGESAAATGIPVLASVGEAAARFADPNASTLRKITGALMGAGDVALTAGAGPIARGLYGLGTGRSIQAGLRAASAGKNARRAMAFERLKQLGIVTGAVGADVVASKAANQLTQKGVEMVGELVGADKEPTKDAAEFLGLLADYGVDLGFVKGAAKLINRPRPKLALGEGKAKVQLGGEPASNAQNRGSSAPATKEPAQRPAPAAARQPAAEAPTPAAAPEPAPVAERVPEQDAPPAKPAGSDRPAPEPVRSAGVDEAPGTVAPRAETKAKTRNLEVATKLELVEADDLVASSTDDLAPNPKYDAELQPRGQDPKETEARIGNILATFDPERLGDSLEAQSGAPILARNDNQVESGNARVLAIRRAMRQNPQQATAYRDYLKANAERFGLDPKQIDSMSAPVLVRRRQTDLSRPDRLKFVEEANEDIVNRTSARQTAKLDRERITPKMFEVLDPEAGIDSPKNGEFVRAFLESVPPTERAQLVGEKGLSDQGRRRIEHALLSKAYGDTPTVRAIIEGDSAGHRNLQKAMAEAAPRFASLNDAVQRGDRFDLSISKELSDAATQLEALREQSMTVDQFVNQQKRLPGTETEGERLADAVLLGVEAHRAAPKRLAGILRRYADLVDAAGSPKQTTMFGAVEPPSKADLFESARRAEEIDHADKQLAPLMRKLDKARADIQLRGKGGKPQDALTPKERAEYDRWTKLKDDLEQGQPIDDASRRFQERAEAETNPLFGKAEPKAQPARKPKLVSKKTTQQLQVEELEAQIRILEASKKQARNEAARKQIDREIADVRRALAIETQAAGTKAPQPETKAAPAETPPKAEGRLKKLAGSKGPTAVAHIRRDDTAAVFLNQEAAEALKVPGLGRSIPRLDLTRYIEALPSDAVELRAQLDKARQSALLARQNYVPIVVLKKEGRTLGGLAATLRHEFTHGAQHEQIDRHLKAIEGNTPERLRFLTVAMEWLNTPAAAKAARALSDRGYSQLEMFLEVPAHLGANYADVGLTRAEALEALTGYRKALSELGVDPDRVSRFMRPTVRKPAAAPPKAPDFTDPRAGAVRLRGSGQRAPRATQPVRFVREPNPEGTLRVQQQRGERVARLFKPGDRPPGKVEQLILDTIEKGKGVVDRIPDRSTLKEQLIDRASVLDEFVGKLRPDLAKNERDPYAARRLFEGSIGKAERTIDRELEPIIRPVRKMFNEVRELAVLERMEELYQQKGIDKNPGGLTPLEVKAWKDRAIARLKRDGKLEKVQTALAELRAYSQRQLAKLNAAGIIDDATYQGILATNQAYIPMQRIGYMTGEGNAAHLPARKFSVAGQDVLHTIVGSQRELVDPLEAIIRNTYKAQTLIDRNEVARKLYDLKDTPEFSELVQPLSKGQDAPQGFGEVKLYVDGEIQQFAVPVRVADSMHGLGREQADLITRVARRGASLLRAGATGLNVAFLPSNAVRDFQTLAVTQQMGVRETAVTWARGLAEVLGKGKYFDEWASAGGSMSGYFETLKGPQRNADSLLRSKPATIARTIANPLEAVRIAGEIIEQAPRVGAFRRARVKLGESPQQAALRSRDATVDFSKVGESVRLVNMWVPFLNARLQGNLNVFKAFRDKPVGTMWAAGQMVLAPAIATYFWNHTQHPEVLEDIEQWEKEQNFVLVLGPEKDADGRYTNVVKMPRGDVGKVLGGTVEAFLDYLHERDSTTWRQLALRVLSDISPVSFERDGAFSLTRMLGDVLPPTLKAGAEAGTGVSFFTGREIVPRSLEGAAPREQYRTDTPSAAVAIGQALDISPLLVHQAIRTQFGAVGDQALRTASGEASGVERSVSRRFTGASGGAIEERDFRDLQAITEAMEGAAAEADRKARRLFDSMMAEPVAKRGGLLKTALREAAASGGRQAAAELLKSVRAEALRREQGPFLRRLRSSPVKARAEFLHKRLRGMAPAERGAYIRDMEAARVLTPTVAEEMKRLP